MSLTRPDSQNLDNSKHGSEETTTGIKTSSQPNKADESKDTLTPNQPTPKIAWYRKHLWLLILGLGLGSVFMVLVVVIGLILGHTPILYNLGLHYKNQRVQRMVSPKQE